MIITQNRELGELLPMASDKRSGLMGIMQFRGSSSYSAGIKSGDFVKLFNLKQYMVCVFDVIAGDTTLVHNSIASIYVNNRCSDKFSIKSKLLWGTLTKLYAKMETDKSVTFYIKIPDVSYPSMKLSFSTPMEYWEGNVDISVDNSVTESDLNIVM